MLDILLDAIIDSLKILPFLFLTYLFMEYLEHKTEDNSKNIIIKSGKLGPLFGSFLGAVPQCGFSASASGLFSGRVISIGTLIAIYLSTSDEMIPIMISGGFKLKSMFVIMGLKVVAALIFGYFIDFIFRNRNKDMRIVDMCHDDHCHCEEGGILKSSLHHTFGVFAFVFVVNLLLGIAVSVIGEDAIKELLNNKSFASVIIAGLVGLIPNCASSVLITRLYLEEIISFGSMMAGLSVGAGVGLAVLFRSNKNTKENLSIVGILYVAGIITGLVFDFIGIEAIL